MENIISLINKEILTRRGNRYAKYAKISQSQNLTPEYKRAIAKQAENIKKWRQLFPDASLSILVDGIVQYVTDGMISDSNKIDDINGIAWHTGLHAVAVEMSGLGNYEDIFVKVFVKYYETHNISLIYPTSYQEPLASKDDFLRYSLICYTDPDKFEIIASYKTVLQKLVTNELTQLEKESIFSSRYSSSIEHKYGTLAIEIYKLCNTNESLYFLSQAIFSIFEEYEWSEFKNDSEKLYSIAKIIYSK